MPRSCAHRFPYLGARGALLSLCGILLAAASALVVGPAAGADPATRLHLPGDVYPTGAAKWESFALAAPAAGVTTWTLQSKVSGGKWVDVRSVKLHDDAFVVRLPPVPMAQLHPRPVTYRVRGVPETPPASTVAPAPAVAAVLTPTKTVRYENPRSYTGYRKALYDAAERWCPAMTVRVSESGIRTATGAMSDAYTWMQNRQVVVRPGLSSFDFRGMMPHECAHIKQGEAYTNTRSGQIDMAKLQRDMARVYGGGLSLGFEYNADCTASVWFGKHRGGAYGGPCSTASQIRAATRIGRGLRI